jgi:hypothetical protein
MVKNNAPKNSEISQDAEARPLTSKGVENNAGENIMPSWLRSGTKRRDSCPTPKPKPKKPKVAPCPAPVKPKPKPRPRSPCDPKDDKKNKAGSKKKTRRPRQRSCSPCNE